MLFHMALNGVSEFLWYRAGDEFVTEGIKNFTAVLVELDEVVGRHGNPLSEVLEPWRATPEAAVD